MAYREILDSEIDPESELRADATPGAMTLFRSLRDNIEALFDGSTSFIEGAAFGVNSISGLKINTGGGPGLNSNKFIPGSITNVAVATNAVTQAEIKENYTDYGVGDYTGLDLGGLFINANGLAMMGWESAVDIAGSVTETYAFGFPGGASPLLAPGGVYEKIYQQFNDLIQLPLSFIWIRTPGFSNPPNRVTGRIHYADASPPYNIGYGDMPLFAFVEILPNGDILRVVTGPTPPWIYNGPTNVLPVALINGKQYSQQRPGTYNMYDPTLYEITQAVKNADMDLVPHPFATKHADSKIVMLDLVNSFGDDLLDLHKDGESIASLIQEGYITLNAGWHVPVRSPKGVATVKGAWA